MTYPIPTNPPWKMGASLHTVAADTASLLTVSGLSASGVSTVGFNPRALSGLVLWLDATQIQGISSGASLSVWTDSSASASHASNPSAVSQPVYVANVQNGQPVVRFTLANKQQLFSMTSMQHPTTILSTVSAPVPSGAAVVFIGNSQMGCDITTTNLWQTYGATVLNTAGSTTSSWVVYCSSFSGSNSSLIVTGQAAVKGATGSASALSVGIGSSVNANFWNGDIGEIVVYNRSLTMSEISQVQDYLGSRWGIAL